MPTKTTKETTQDTTQRFHVIFDRGKWTVRKSPRGQVSGRYNTKQEAIDAALKAVNHQPRKVLIHGRTGQVFHGTDLSGKVSDTNIREAIRKSSSKSTRPRLTTGTSTPKKTSTSSTFIEKQLKSRLK